MFKIQICKIINNKLDEPNTEIIQRGNGANLGEKFQNLSKYFNADVLTKKISILFKPYLQSKTPCEIYINLLNPFAPEGSESEFKKLIFSYNFYTINNNVPDVVSLMLEGAIIDTAAVLNEYINDVLSSLRRE